MALLPSPSPPLPPPIKRKKEEAFSPLPFLSSFPTHTTFPFFFKYIKGSSSFRVHPHVDGRHFGGWRRRHVAAGGRDAPDAPGGDDGPAAPALAWRGVVVVVVGGGGEDGGIGRYKTERTFISGCNCQAPFYSTRSSLVKGQNKAVFTYYNNKKEGGLYILLFFQSFFQRGC